MHASGFKRCMTDNLVRLGSHFSENKITKKAETTNVKELTFSILVTEGAKYGAEGQHIVNGYHTVAIAIRLFQERCFQCTAREAR